MTAVVDANVVVALLVDLAYSVAARKAVAVHDGMVAPDLLVPEVTNTLWKIVRANQTSAAHADAALAQLSFLVTEIVPGRALAAAAFALARELDHSAYDCFYLSLAIERRVSLITADRRLADKARSTSARVEFVGGT